MRRDLAARGALLAAGLALGGFGAFSLLRLGIGNLLWAVLWLAGGVVVHDAVLAPLVVAAWAGGRWRLPRWSLVSVIGGVVVLGATTLLAVPVLGRFGARPDNPSLLDRPYGEGWLAFAGLVVVGVAVGCLVTWRRQARASDGPADEPAGGPVGRPTGGPVGG